MHIHIVHHLSRIRACATALVLAVGLAGCGSTNWGFPYKATIQQGNWITSEQVARLEIGMTRDQVRYLLGTPTLQDAFHSDRWDYPFYNQPGYGQDELRKFTVWFDHDRLARWVGDRQPDRQPFERADSGVTAAEVAQEGRADIEARDASSPDLGEVVDTEIQVGDFMPQIQRGL